MLQDGHCTIISHSHMQGTSKRVVQNHKLYCAETDTDTENCTKKIRYVPMTFLYIFSKLLCCLYTYILNHKKESESSFHCTAINIAR